MKFLAIAPFDAKPQDTWLNGALEGIRELGHQVRAVNARYDGAVAQDLVDSIKDEVFDVAVWMLWNSYIEEEALSLVRKAAKRVVLWYPDIYPRNLRTTDFAFPTRYFPRYLDLVGVPTPLHISLYERMMDVKTVYLPHGCLRMEFPSKPRYDRNVLFVGSRPPDLKWRRTEILDEMAKRFPIEFFPPDGKFNALNMAGALEMFQHSRINLAVDRYRSYLMATSSRTYDILAAGGFLMHPEFEGMDGLFPPGTCGKFNGVEDWAERAAWWLGHDEERECARYSGWANGQNNHPYSSRILTILREIGP